MAYASNQLYGLIQEPDAEVHELKRVCGAIIDCLKSFLIAFWEFPKLAVDERLALGSILVEYLFPLVVDSYLMEEQLLQFLYEVTLIPKPELTKLILDLLEAHLAKEQMEIFVAQLMKPLVKKILNVEIVVAVQGKPAKKDFDMTYF